MVHSVFFSIFPEAVEIVFFYGPKQFNLLFIKSLFIESHNRLIYRSGDSKFCVEWLSFKYDSVLISPS